MQEIWKDIKGYEDLYQVSNLGRVKNKKTNNIRKTYISKIGYYAINLYKKDNRKTTFLHRLIAEAFIPNPNNLPCVNHKDENKLNNNLDNLEWCSYSYNNTYGIGQENRKKALSKSLTNNPNRSTPVNQYDLSGNLIKSYPSISEAYRATGINLVLIHRVIKGKQKQTKGYVWRCA